MRKYLIIAGVLLAFIIVWLVWRHHDNVVDAKTSSTTLPPGVKEKVIVNPDTHQLTIVTPTSTDALFLPDRPSSIEIQQNGQTSVQVQEFGTEHHLFGGLGYASDARSARDLRLYCGLDLFYVKNWDAGLFGSTNLNHLDARIGIDVSRNLLGNSRITLGLDNQKQINVMVTLRF